MSLIPYVPNMEVWKNLPVDQPIQSSYLLQKGRGGASAHVQVITPEEAIINRAKAKLKRQINKAKPTAKRQLNSGRKRKQTKKILSLRLNPRRRRKHHDDLCL